MKEKIDVYSKENLTQFVEDIITYIWDIKLYDNVLIYCMNQCYYVNLDKTNRKIGNIPIYVEEDVDVTEYIDYSDPKTLSISLDCKLNDYLFLGEIEGSDEIIKQFKEIFESHGFYYEFANCWSLNARVLE